MGYRLQAGVIQTHEDRQNRLPMGFEERLERLFRLHPTASSFRYAAILPHTYRGQTLFPAELTQ